MQTTQERIQDLRTRAEKLRTSADHADSRAAYSADMQAAQRCDAEADELAASLESRDD
ncbi:hypothetical protein [Methylomonas fluvii]|uniref:Uncharacterized protein n=1 Tax=Methylomonas fluvii TaxID=1854564 RepID=A0ABR9DKR1_9GAMM|nr:hypothetical protein [Methylomonas fluvii]MBD9362918.1 hypothetical protein [Methylomonas fluvii]CAD6876103.1 hypothetical protein [Methylomonas fluvii]